MALSKANFGTAFFTDRETKLIATPFAPSRSPGATRMTRSSFKRSATAATVAAKFSRTKRKRGDESVICNSSSRDV